MFRIIGIIVTFVAISRGLLSLEASMGFNFLSNIICNDYLAIMATLIGLNMTSIAFLIGNINEISIKLNDKKLFSGVRKELKDNINFMLLVLIPIGIISSGLFDCSVGTDDLSLLSQISLIAGSTVFLLALFCIYETTQLIFKIKI